MHGKEKNPRAWEPGFQRADHPKATKQSYLYTTRLYT